VASARSRAAGTSRRCAWTAQTRSGPWPFNQFEFRAMRHKPCRSPGCCTSGSSGCCRMAWAANSEGYGTHGPPACRRSARRGPAAGGLIDGQPHSQTSEAKFCCGANRKCSVSWCCRTGQAPPAADVDVDWTPRHPLRGAATGDGTTPVEVSLCAPPRDHVRRRIRPGVRGRRLPGIRLEHIGVSPHERVGRHCGSENLGEIRPKVRCRERGSIRSELLRRPRMPSTRRCRG